MCTISRSWLGNKGQLLTCGFTKQSKRQFKIWDPKSLDKPIATCQIDSGAGVLMPFWDEALNMLYLCGKGDGNIRYYEITDTAPFYCKFVESGGERGIKPESKFGRTRKYT